MKKTGKRLEEFRNEFLEELRSQGKSLEKIDSIYDAVNNNEIDSLLKQLESSLKKLDSAGMSGDLQETEERICNKIDSKFELVDKHLLGSMERMSEMRFRVLELRKLIADARKELADEKIFVEELERAMEKTLEPKELEVLNVINRVGEIDIHDISVAVSEGKEEVEKLLKTLVDLNLIEGDNLGRRVLFKPRKLMAYN